MANILAETPDRFLLLPVRDEQAWQFYQEAVACFWTAQELDLTHDRYGELQDGERTLLNNVLAFFAAADGVAGENLACGLSPNGVAVSGPQVCLAPSCIVPQGSSLRPSP